MPRSPERDLAAYLPPAEALEKRPLPLLARSVLYLLLLLLILAVVWGAVSSIDRVVSTSGKLVTSEPNVIINPLENSILRELHVRPGDRIKAGDVVATLDPTFSAADLALQEKRLSTVKLQLARLDAELRGVPLQDQGCLIGEQLGYRTPTSDRTHQTSARSKGHAGDALVMIATAETPAAASMPAPVQIMKECAAAELQNTIFKRRHRVYTTKIATFRESLAKIQAQASTTRTMLTGVEERLGLERQILGMVTKLSESQIASRMKLLEVRRSVVDLTAERARLLRLDEELKQETRRITADRAAFVEDWKLDVVNQRLDLQNELDQLEEKVTKARLMSDLVQLRAPIDGTVLELADGLSMGSIVAETEPLVKLSATEAPLLAEVEIPARDIGRVRVGDPVRIKVEAFPFQRHGVLNGELVMISADAFSKPVSEGGGSFYRARLDLGDDTLENVPADTRLAAGMNVIGEMVIGNRTVLSYFLYPIIRVLDEGIREP